MRRAPWFFVLLAPLACSGPSSADDDGASTGTAGSAGTGSSEGSSSSSGAAADESGDSADSSGETGAVTVETELPPLPELLHVTVRMVGDAANVTFDPVEGAADYRIYPLPADEDLAIGGDGSVIVADAIYRCAGHREGLYMLNDILGTEEGWNDNSAGGITYLHNEVAGFLRSDDDALLGHVYQTAGEDRVPVYVLGDPDLAGEGGPECGRAAFRSTRPKTYTTDSGLRDELIAARWRDDGIGFYVPSQAGDATKPLYEGTFGDGNTVRWVDGPEATMRGSGTQLFDVVREATEETIPLMRVHVAPYCTRSHDELAAGTPQFNRARSEGDQPLTEVRWSGVTEGTVLVVEALESGCPFQGNLSTQHAEPPEEEFGGTILDYEDYLTIDDMRQASPTGEVFVNGQYDDAVAPRAIARSFVQVDPDIPDMDFYATFADDDFWSAFSEPTGNNYGLHFTSDDYTFSAYNFSRVFFGSMLGELWVMFDDAAADTNGKIRLTPHQMAEIHSDSFLHVTTEFDIISTGRRYPQIIISDRTAPVQDGLVDGVTLVIQPKDFTPSYLQVQICDHKLWDVNDQCPQLPTRPIDHVSPATLPGEHTGTDNAIQVDAYLSTERLYLFMNAEPYACVNLPAASFEDGETYAPPSGPVTVTWGDVLYHSAVDFQGGSGVVDKGYQFHQRHMQITTRRHFDNLGFSSEQPEPEWDENLLPCQGAG